MSANALIIRLAGGHLFGFEVVLYLWLGGLGGGLSAVAGVAGLSIPRRFLQDGLVSLYSNLMRMALVIAAALLALGSMLLLADSDNFAALAYLFLSPPFGYLSVGAWLIVVDMGLCLILVLFWRAGSAGQNFVVSRILHAVCMIVGLAVALYTGLFLASMKAVPLWNTPWLPALFVLSSISCGIVLFLVLHQASDKGATFSSYMKLLAKVDVAIVALELLCALALVVGLVIGSIGSPTSTAGAASAYSLIAGEYAWIWWGGFVGLGIVLTALLDIMVIRVEKSLPGRIWSTLGVSFCVAAGALSLRYCIVAAGMHPALGF